MPLTFSDLPNEVLRLCLASEVFEPRDHVAVLLVSRRLQFLAKSAPVQFHLKAKQDNSQSALKIRRVLVGASSSFPGTSSMDCSCCPLEDADISQLMNSLQNLQNLNLSGCKKLTGSVSTVIFPGFYSAEGQSLAASSKADPAHSRRPQKNWLIRKLPKLRTVMMQRCFQLTPRALSDALLASMPPGNYLTGVALSHLDLRSWPDSPLALVLMSQIMYRKGGKEGMEGSQQQDQSNPVEGLASLMQQLGIHAGPAKQHACVSNSGTSGASLEPTLEAHPYPSPDLAYLCAMSPTGLRILALHNCSGISVCGLQAVARSCPCLEALFLGGSNLALEEAAAGNPPGVHGPYTSRPPRPVLPLEEAMEATAAGHAPLALLPATSHIGAHIQIARGQDMPDEFMDCNGNMRSIDMVRATAASALAGLRFARFADPIVLAAAVEFATLAALLPKLVVLELSFALPGLVPLLQQLHEEQKTPTQGAGHSLEQPTSHETVSMHHSRCSLNVASPGDTAWDQMMTAMAGSDSEHTRPRVQFWDMCQPLSVERAVAWRRSHRTQAESAKKQAVGTTSEVAAFLRAAVSCSSGAKVTPLHIAAEEGRCSMARDLLRLGATVLARDRSGASPLFRACELGHTSAVQLLLQAGADVKQRNSAGEAPLYIAALRGHEQVVQLLLEHCAQSGMVWEDPALYGDGWTPLMAAAVGGRTAIARRLLSTAGKVQATDMVHATNRYGQTAVHIAARRGSWDLLQCLIEAGGGAAVALVVDCNGSTAADVARRSANAAAWELLRVFGEGESQPGVSGQRGRRGRRERKAAKAAATAAAAASAATSAAAVSSDAQAGGNAQPGTGGRGSFNRCGAVSDDSRDARRQAAAGELVQPQTSVAEGPGDSKQWVGRRLGARKSEASQAGDTVYE